MKNQVFSVSDEENNTFNLKLDDIFIFLVIIFVGFGSFGLGRLSSQTAKINSGINLSNISAQATPTNQTVTNSKETEPTMVSGGQLVASKNGGKYHFPWCSGAQRILDENKIWFNSSNEARSQGYEPAANCKGLD